MGKLETPSKNLNLTIDTGSLNEVQVRLIRSINSLILHVSLTEDEEDFFEGSSELMRLAALVVKHAKFGSQSVRNSKIPYSMQALELSLDNLEEALKAGKLLTIDN